MHIPTQASRDPEPLTRADLLPAQRIYLDRYGTWPRFHHGPRRSGLPLLRNLSRYPDCVLVAGCQRSGTTMLTRIIAGAAGFRRLALTTDDELDAALALAGYVDLPVGHRYCFQTTYLNECYPEYGGLGPAQRLIWVVRNPNSVVHSMVHNWRRFALDELYEFCGSQPAEREQRRRRARWPWPFGASSAHKACSAYAGKARQIFAIRNLIQPAQLLVVDYDRLVSSPAETLRTVFDFIGEPYVTDYAAVVRPDSARKADRQSAETRSLVEEIATPVYRQCRQLLDERRAT
jgi:hypothetical protein